MAKANRGKATPLRHDEAALSEIVGALLLVVVVSSAAFGFGLFLHAQAKATEEQKNAELQRSLESIAVLSVTPVDRDFNVDCTDAASDDGFWNALSFAISSLHLKDSRLAGIRVNGLMVQFATVGAITYDFSLQPEDVGYQAFVVAARQQLTVELENVAVDPDSPVDYVGACGSAQPYSFFGAAPSTAPLAATDAIRIEVLTELTNNFERVFIPPDAVILLDTLGGAATSYVLDAGTSTPGSEGAFLVKWAWSVSCTASDPDCDPTPWTKAGRIAQASVIGDDAGDPGTVYTITLTVTDNFGMTGTATFAFTL